MWLARSLSEKPLTMTLGLFPLHILDFGDPVCLDTHFPGPGGRGEELELPTGQETLTALKEEEGRGEGVGGVGGCWEEGQKWKLL